MRAAVPPLASALADRYILERELGHGGTATVYLAEERKHGRQVAIKVLHQELAASLGAERFLREIGIAARLSHPHIVPLIDSGEAEGTLYYVAPYVTGGSLRDRLARGGALPITDAVRIAEEVGAGLDYAHRSGIIHRDVKPENILFADGHALLADFGIARTRADDAAGPPITSAGMAVGTPAYMSPEQASGEATLGTASDLYSFACVVHEMLAGVPPFHGAGVRATLAKHVTEPPPPLRAMRPEVTPAMEGAVLRALAKDPAARWGSVAELVEALVASTAPSAIRLPTTVRSIAVLPFVNASPDPDNEYLSDGITDELIDALAKLPGLRVASRTSVFALKGRAQDVRSIGSLLGPSVVLEGTVRRSGDRLRVGAQLTSTSDGRLLWSQRYDRTVDDVLAIQDELARTIVSALRATSLGDLEDPHRSPRRATASADAYTFYLRGRYAANRRTTEGVAEGIAWYERAIAADPRFALAYTGLSDAWALHVDYRSVPVAEGLEKAAHYARQALAIDDSLAEAHASLAWTLFIYDWTFAEAEREFRRAIELGPRYAPGHQWYAFLLSSAGRTNEALIEGHTAIELDPGSLSARRSLGWQYYYARRPDETQYHLGRALEMNPVSEETYRVIGLALAIAGDHAHAERVLREAIAMPTAGSYTAATLGYALGRAGKRDEARAIRDELEEGRRAGYVSPAALATVALGLDDHERALDWMERARDERRGWLVYLAVNPIFDPLRGIPRFERLLHAMAIGAAPHA